MVSGQTEPEGGSPVEATAGFPLSSASGLALTPGSCKQRKNHEKPIWSQQMHSRGQRDNFSLTGAVSIGSSDSLDRPRESDGFSRCFPTSEAVSGMT